MRMDFRKAARRAGEAALLLASAAGMMEITSSATYVESLALVTGGALGGIAGGAVGYGAGRLSGEFFGRSFFKNRKSMAEGISTATVLLSGGLGLVFGTGAGTAAAMIVADIPPEKLKFSEQAIDSEQPIKIVHNNKRLTFG